MSAITFMPSKIGRLKELTNQLLLEEDYVMSFFQVCPDMLCVLDEHKCIVHMNNAWNDILGRTREELLTYPLTTVVMRDDVQETNHIIQSLKTNQVVRFYTKCENKDKEEVPLEWTAVLSDDGNVYASARVVPHECVECERARQNMYPHS
jgi:PAS domain S-box-containing protein